MRNIARLLLGFVMITSLLSSCNATKSLEVFIVDQQEKSDVISLDLQPSMLLAGDKIKDEEDKAIINSLKKLILIGYKVTDETQDRYLSELTEVRSILKQEKYEEFIRFGKGSRGVKIYIVGAEDKIDELIILGNDHKIGWGLVRVLGENMEPEKMAKVLKKLDFDKNNFNLSMFENLNIEL